jgi:serine/threonine protein kinase
MPLAAGAWFGPYEVLSQIGVGNRGDVYRGHDSRLERDVALKTLPAEFSPDSSHQDHRHRGGLSADRRLQDWIGLRR